jgi:hypothetical protein
VFNACANLRQLAFLGHCASYFPHPRQLAFLGHCASYFPHPQPFTCRFSRILPTVCVLLTSCMLLGQYISRTVPCCLLPRPTSCCACPVTISTGELATLSSSWVWLGHLFGACSPPQQALKDCCISKLLQQHSHLAFFLLHLLRAVQRRRGRPQCFCQDPT